MKQQLSSPDPRTRADAYEALILSVLGGDGLRSPQIARGYESLSGGFLKESGTPDLRESPEMLAAMGLIYGARTFHVTHRLFSRWPPLSPVLDLGCGWAPAALNAALLGHDTVLLDKNPTLLKQAQRCFSTLGLPSPNAIRGRAEQSPRRLGSIVMAFSWNELHQENLVADLMEHLVPGGRLYLVEPGNQARAQRLVLLRDAMAPRFRILGPCPGQSSTCPMKARPKDWCHLTYDDPLGLLGAEALGMLHRQVSSFHASWLVLSREPPAQAAGRSLLSLRERSKAKVVFHTCTGEAIEPLNALQRNREVCDWLLSRERGARLELASGLQRKGDGYRVSSLDELKEL